MYILFLTYTDVYIYIGLNVIYILTYDLESQAVLLLKPPVTFLVANTLMQLGSNEFSSLMKFSSGIPEKV